MTFIAGRYTATWNGLACGQVADGFRLASSMFMRPISGDAGGDTVQDGVYRGAGVEISFTMIEYDSAAVQSLIWPQAATIFDLGIIGMLATSLAKALVLTRVSSSTTATPASLTLSKTLLKEGYPVGLLYASDLREVPISLRSFPNSSGVFGTQS
jgi:hypothetical protein